MVSDTFWIGVCNQITIFGESNWKIDSDRKFQWILCIFCRNDNSKLQKIAWLHHSCENSIILSYSANILNKFICKYWILHISNAQTYTHTRNHDFSSHHHLHVKIKMHVFNLCKCYRPNKIYIIGIAFEI